MQLSIYTIFTIVINIIIKHALFYLFVQETKDIIIICTHKKFNLCLISEEVERLVVDFVERLSVFAFTRKI